ncbi:MAG: hypothetical protein NVV64_08645 [Cellulomonas sp.]|nr:hypothetical protein [Cellulomonas sp.]MCR6689428.1 hypothetical protein [Cellulomonas sp.]
MTVRRRGGARRPALRHVPTLALLRVRSRLTRSGAADRGDVPGWVMVTLMTAMLVAALLVFTQPLLEGLFEDAVKQVEP